MSYTDLRTHLVNGGRVDRPADGDHFRLVLPPIGAATYADAQIDDYPHEPPRKFTNAPPQHLRLRARFSHTDMKGTAGFGFWNHPFDRDGGVLAPPCNAWFFYSSPESRLQVARHGPSHGFKASLLNSAPGLRSSGRAAVAFNRLTAAAVRLATPALNLLLRAPGLSGLVLSAARSAVQARETALDLDMTGWHEYSLDWHADVATFAVDGRQVLRAPNPPRAPLGFVAWVDNYRATAGGSRRYEFAYVDVMQEQWMELQILDWCTT